MNTPMTFGRLAKGFCFQVLDWEGKPIGSILQKTGVRAARRCDVTLPPMRFRLGAAIPIVVDHAKEVV